MARRAPRLCRGRRDGSTWECVPGGFRSNPRIYASCSTAAIHHEAVEGGDLSIARPGAGECWIRGAEHVDIVDDALAHIDHGDIGATDDKVVRDPATDRPRLGAGRVEADPPKLSFERPHRVET